MLRSRSSAGRDMGDILRSLQWWGSRQCKERFVKSSQCWCQQQHIHTELQARKKVLVRLGDPWGPEQVPAASGRPAQGAKLCSPRFRLGNQLMRARRELTLDRSTFGAVMSSAFSTLPTLKRESPAPGLNAQGNAAPQLALLRP